MGFWTLKEAKINKKTGEISGKLVEMGVKKPYRITIEHKDMIKEIFEADYFYKSGDNLSPKHKYAEFIMELVRGQTYVDDINSKYFRLNYQNRKWHKEDMEFTQKYEKEFRRMMGEAVKRHNSKKIYFANLPVKERGAIIIKLNKKFEKEIQNIMDGKTVTGIPLKDWEIEDQNENLKFICENSVPIIEIDEENEDEEELE